MAMRFGWICLEPLATLWLLMLDYFIRRFLLIPPTLLGISFMVFLVTRAAPGGPIEQAMMQMQQMMMQNMTVSYTHLTLPTILLV